MSTPNAERCGPSPHSVALPSSPRTRPISREEARSALPDLPRSVKHLGSLPPPLGGVTIHCERAQQAMVDLGLDSAVLNFTKRAQSGRQDLCGLHAVVGLVSCLVRREPIFVHISAMNSLARVARVVASSWLASRCHLVLVPHSGTFPTDLGGRGAAGLLLRLSLRRYSVALCFSSEIETAIHRARPSLRIVRGSPFIADAKIRHVRSTPQPPKKPVVISSGYRTAIYGYDELLSAWRDLTDRPKHSELHLYVYGETDLPYWQGVAKAARRLSDVVIHEDASHVDFLHALKGGALYVRNTSHDSYGVALAESLYLGTRAIASDVADRPAGTRVYRRRDVQQLKALIHNELTQSGTPESVDNDGTDAYRETLHILAQLDRPTFPNIKQRLRTEKSGKATGSSLRLKRHRVLETLSSIRQARPR